MTLSLEQTGGTGRIEFATSSNADDVAAVAESMTKVVSVPCELVIAFAPDDQQQQQQQQQQGQGQTSAAAAAAAARQRQQTGGTRGA